MRFFLSGGVFLAPFEVVRSVSVETPFEVVRSVSVETAPPRWVDSTRMQLKNKNPFVAQVRLDPTPDEENNSMTMKFDNSRIATGEKEEPEQEKQNEDKEEPEKEKQNEDKEEPEKENKPDDRTRPFHAPFKFNYFDEEALNSMNKEELVIRIIILQILVICHQFWAN